MGGACGGGGCRESEMSRIGLMVGVGDCRNVKFWELYSWLVVVVVAASETVRLSWLVPLTVDTLSPEDLTSQGFFISPRVPVCICV